MGLGTSLTVLSRGLLVMALAAATCFVAVQPVFASSSGSHLTFWAGDVDLYTDEDVAESVEVTYAPSTDATYDAYTITVSVDGAPPDDIDDYAADYIGDGKCTSYTTYVSCSVAQSSDYVEPHLGSLGVNIDSKDTVSMKASGSFDYYDGEKAFINNLVVSSEGDDNTISISADATFPSGYDNPFEVGVGSMSDSCGSKEKITLSGTASKWSALSTDDCHDYFYVSGVKDRSSTLDIVSGTDTDPSPTDKIYTIAGFGGTLKLSDLKFPVSASGLPKITTK